MKKIILSLFIISIFATSCTMQNFASGKSSENPIDIELEKCLNQENQSTQQMRQCVYRSMDAWFEEIDKNLELIKTSVSEDDYQVILKSQKDWEEYQKSEFESITLLMEQGTMFHNIADSMKMELVKKRALYLKEYYDTVKI